MTTQGDLDALRKRLIERYGTNAVAEWESRQRARTADEWARCYRSALDAGIPTAAGFHEDAARAPAGVVFKSAASSREDMPVRLGSDPDTGEMLIEDPATGEMVTALELLQRGHGRKRGRRIYEAAHALDEAAKREENRRLEDVLERSAGWAPALVIGAR